MEEIMKTLPKHTCSWLKNRFSLYNYHGVWNHKEFLEGRFTAEQTFKAHPNDVFLCTYPKSGTTWIKALAFAIISRQNFDTSTSPLLTSSPHDCITFLEKDVEQIKENHENHFFQPISTHIPYNALPESIISSNCKIVYIYRNMKDVIVSYYHFHLKLFNLSDEEAGFEVACDEFCQGVSSFGPFWDHILGYWKASLEKPEIFLFLKYEDMKKDPISNVKKLAEFIGHPFTPEEEEAGVIESVVKMCSFETLSNLEVNKKKQHRHAMDNQLYFRKAKEGDWENHFTKEMVEKIDKLIDERFGASGLVLK